MILLLTLLVMLLGSSGCPVMGRRGASRLLTGHRSRIVRKSLLSPSLLLRFQGTTFPPILPLLNLLLLQLLLLIVLNHTRTVFLVSHGSLLLVQLVLRWLLMD